MGFVGNDKASRAWKGIIGFLWTLLNINNIQGHRPCFSYLNNNKDIGGNRNEEKHV